MFKLKSLGFGSAFNSQEYGNNSWYFIENDKSIYDWLWFNSL